MAPSVEIRFYAGLKALEPTGAGGYPIEPGIPVGRLLESLEVPIEKVKLVFVDGRRADLDRPLTGGERLAVFPPVGGG